MSHKEELLKEEELNGIDHGSVAGNFSILPVLSAGLRSFEFVYFLVPSLYP
jgi:hypothetical protein